MPKKVDHAQRRVLIAEALLRLASTGGLEAVSLRDVAAEAGISMGAVQHYFATKEEMLAHAMDYAVQRAGERIEARLAENPEQVTTRDVLRALMLEMLATTDDSRREFLVSIAFFQRAVAAPELAAHYREFWPRLEKWITEELREAQTAGELTEEVDPAREAELIVLLPDALSQGLLLGHRTEQDAAAAIDYHLDQLFD
ncbi:TetR/AcrR family transcriptional regulator [Saccharopolyspora cebuensis]|uniref:TetR/AcrR family transcriptional regulator n=1 Tax=Saccharopolyspora cebuensis TaxID=418759 RepID=A0ABV4CQI2_9PSEU